MYIMLQSGGNLAQREKCWKDGSLAKVRKLNNFAQDLTDFLSSCSFLPVSKL